MSNVRDSDTSLWLHNKLGTSNDSWISGSICSQLNKEVLRNIKDCFVDLQTQVKLKLLLSFFHIPRRMVEEWKTELEEVIEVAGLDSELWVSMLAETMKTFPATGSLNTEISDYEETRPIFTDMVNDLRKLVSKHSDLGMLPLECLYLNKNALVSVVGQHQNPTKHFTIKRKPKSANLRTELLHKSADAQSSLKKNTAPTIPLRSRGMPRKMTDTTPMKGIPSRVPTSGFRSPNIQPNQQRPNLSRTPAGRKDGGIKLIEFTEQPLGYAAAKKRKREQQLEEQQKKQEQKQAAAASAANSSSPTTSPTQSNTQGATAISPTTPTSTNATFEIKSEPPSNLNQNNTVDENQLDVKEPLISAIEITKSEPITPEYAPSLTYAQTPITSSHIGTSMEDNKAAAKSIINMTSIATSPPALSKVTNSIVHTPANSSNSLMHNNKRFKQEIEIKSEEIIVPPNIKVEKVEPQQILTQASGVLQTQQIQQSPTSRFQQRVVIQQQPQSGQPSQHVLIRAAPQPPKQTIGSVTLTSSSVRNNATPIKMEKLDIKPITRTSTVTTNATNTSNLLSQQLRQTANPLANLPNNISVKITSSKSKSAQQQQVQQQPILINSNTPVILSSPTQTIRQKSITSPTTATNAQTIKSMPLSQLKNATSSGPVIISQTIIQPAKRNANSSAGNSVISQQSQQQHTQQSQSVQQATNQYILTSSTPQQQQNTQIPSLTSFAQTRPATQNTTLYQTNTNSQMPTKILIKTSNSNVMMTPMRQQQTGGNPPPLIASTSINQPQTMLNIQNVQLPNRPVTIQPASQAAQQQHLQAQLQQQQPQQQHTIVSNTSATQQPKLTQMVVQPNANAGVGTNISSNNKNKTIILPQKGLILRNIGGDMYQQIPISNVSALQNIGTGTTLMTNAAGPPSLVKTSQSTGQQHTIQLQQQTQTTNKPQLQTIIPQNTITPQHVIVQQPQTNLINQTQQTIIRPVVTNVPGGLTALPQGLTLIQRPGHQPQLVQVQTASTAHQPTQIQRTIITQPATQQQQIRPQQIVLQHKPAQQRIITTSGQPQHIQIQQNNPSIPRTTQIVQVQQQQQNQQQAPQRKGLSLSNEHVHKAHEMFRKANRVSRPDKALILGFMAGLRENPRPNPENVLVIKLGESEEKVQQEDGSTALCLVESHIRLDYNTGEWKTFQNYRRLDQSGVSDTGSVMQAQNSVVI
ncbi:negative elongation factor A [Teleopsis dalmanni]|uniref:negative elongation factor A n=1 Tax=Teleopsis dalmanni TaxID=139649 RepID=UPI0018CD1620|nr:negative elongation factor A [Teleopsis dalmanni]